MLWVRGSNTRSLCRTEHKLDVSVGRIPHSLYAV